MTDRNNLSRRRRSSSILQVYHEPPETLEQISDQAALPNLNANWTSAKGTLYLSLVFGERHRGPPLRVGGPPPRHVMEVKTKRKESIWAEDCHLAFQSIRTCKVFA